MPLPGWTLVEQNQLVTWILANWRAENHDDVSGMMIYGRKASPPGMQQIFLLNLIIPGRQLYL